MSTIGEDLKSSDDDVEKKFFNKLVTRVEIETDILSNLIHLWVAFLFHIFLSLLKTNLTSLLRYDIKLFGFRCIFDKRNGSIWLK